MYNMLVVDDERFAVQGISRAIDWRDLPIGCIHEAYGLKDAAAIAAEHKLHLLIVDIEMPGTSGFEVMDKIKESHPDIETIFLTAHADFSYAQRAIQMGSYDYILKPFDHDQLKAVVRDAIGKIGEDEEQHLFLQQYQQYLGLWEKQRPVLVERFWQDLLQGRTIPTDGYLAYAAELYGLPIQADDRVVPVLISLESWNQKLTAREEAILEFALGNIASETFGGVYPGEIVKVPGGQMAILRPDGSEAYDEARIADTCGKLIAACQQYLHCTLTCYVGKPVNVGSVSEAYGRLQEMERYNIHEVNRVMFLDKEEPRHSGAASFKWPDIRVLLDMNKHEEAVRKTYQAFEEMERESAGTEALEAFYVHIVGLVFQMLHERNLSVHDVFESRELMDGPAVTASIPRMKSWTRQTLEKLASALSASGGSHSAIVERVCQYIKANLASEIGRDDLAAVVHLNPAYLSRLFKKVKGVSMSDYMLAEKMDRAKTLLTTTNLKVTTIAEQVGCSHYTYFSKLFRKVVGVTPQEYRKSYQSV